MTAVCRFSLPIRDLDPEGRCVVLEVPEDAPADGNAVWIDVHAIAWDSVEPDAARDLLWRALAKTTALNAGQVAGRFVQPGWLMEVLTWARSSLAGHGVELTGTWSQYNMGPDFALLRFDAVGRDVWFKAVGEPNHREFGITKRLAELRLPHLPPLLAQREDWHGWLMFDCGDGVLDEQAEPRHWECAARALAELQIESSDRLRRSWTPVRGSESAQLIQTGRSISRFDGLADGRATRRLSAALSREELGRLGKQIQGGLAHLDQLGIPDTLGHLDLNPGNIVMSSEECVFLDWAEACVGHPFFSFQYLLEYFRRVVQPDSVWQAELTGTYAECWEPLCRPKQSPKRWRSHRCWPLLPARRGAFRADRKRCASPGTARHLRSLTRRMHHEALRWMEEGSRCLC